jgi:hypothetical protein
VRVILLEKITGSFRVEKRMHDIKNIAKLGLLVVVVVTLSGCAYHPLKSSKIFSNAQVQYQARERKNTAKRRNMEMPSYFLELDYAPGQIALNKTQIHKINSVFKKLIYPEEYKLYVSFGSGSDKNQLANLSPIFKRAQDIKRKYENKVGSIQIAYLKNQRPNCIYLRLLA